MNQIIHDDILNHPNLDIRKVNLEQLLWPILQSNWPNIRLQALLAFMQKVTIQDSAMEARLWQHFHEIGMTFQPWQHSDSRPSSAPLNSMTAMSHHFKDHLSAMRFLDANMATATKLRSMTLDCTHSNSDIVKRISAALQYFSWINSGSGVLFIAHLQSLSNKDEWTSHVVRLRGCFHDGRMSKSRYLVVGTVPLHVLSLQDTLDAREYLPVDSYVLLLAYLQRNSGEANEIQDLRRKVNAYFAPNIDRSELPTDWSPKHIEWNINLQDEGADHLDVLQFLRCTVNYPDLFDMVRQSIAEAQR